MEKLKRLYKIDERLNSPDPYELVSAFYDLAYVYTKFKDENAYQKGVSNAGKLESLYSFTPPNDNAKFYHYYKLVYTSVLFSQSQQLKPKIIEALRAEIPRRAGAWYGLTALPFAKTQILTPVDVLSAVPALYELEYYKVSKPFDPSSFGGFCSFHYSPEYVTLLAIDTIYRMYTNFLNVTATYGDYIDNCYDPYCLAGVSAMVGLDPQTGFSLLKNLRYYRAVFSAQNIDYLVSEYGRLNYTCTYKLTPPRDPVEVAYSLKATYPQILQAI